MVYRSIIGLRRPPPPVDPHEPLLRPWHDQPASPPTRRPRAPRRPVRASRRPRVALRRPSPPCSYRDTCIAPTRRPRPAHQSTSPASAASARRPGGLPRRPRSRLLGTATSGSSAASTRAPLLHWSLGPRCPAAGAALAARVLVLTSSSARRPTPSVVAALIADSAATPPPPSGVPDLTRARLDHPLAVVIRLIYAARPTWPVGYVRLRRSREDRPEYRAPLRRSSIGLPLRRPIGPQRHRPVVLLATALTRASPLRRPFEP